MIAIIVIFGIAVLGVVALAVVAYFDSRDAKFREGDR